VDYPSSKDDMQHVLQLRSALRDVEPHVPPLRRSSVTSASPLVPVGRRGSGSLPTVAPSSQLRDPWSHISELGKFFTVDNESNSPNDGLLAARRESGDALGSVTAATVSNSSKATAAHAVALAAESGTSLNRAHIDGNTSARADGAPHGEHMLHQCCCIVCCRLSQQSRTHRHCSIIVMDVIGLVDVQYYQRAPSAKRLCAMELPRALACHTRGICRGICQRWQPSAGGRRQPPRPFTHPFHLVHFPPLLAEDLQLTMPDCAGSKSATEQRQFFCHCHEQLN
jgi:hypothetical protein